MITLEATIEKEIKRNAGKWAIIANDGPTYMGKYDLYFHIEDGEINIWDSYLVSKKSGVGIPRFLVEEVAFFLMTKARKKRMKINHYVCFAHGSATKLKHLFVENRYKTFKDEHYNTKRTYQP